MSDCEHNATFQGPNGLWLCARCGAMVIQTSPPTLVDVTPDRDYDAAV